MLNEKLIINSFTWAPALTVNLGFTLYFPTVDTFNLLSTWNQKNIKKKINKIKKYFGSQSSFGEVSLNTEHTSIFRVWEILLELESQSGFVIPTIKRAKCHFSKRKTFVVRCRRQTYFLFVVLLKNELKFYHYCETWSS